MIIVTIDQKSCKRILICGSACICSSVFGLFCIYHYSFPGVLQVIALLYCVGTSRFGISWIAQNFKQLTQGIGSKTLQVICYKTKSKILSWWIHQLRNFLQSSNSHLKNRLNLQGVMLSREAVFWLKSNLQSSKFGISRIEWRRRFDTFNSRICSKSCSNWICIASCCRKRSCFFD